MNLIETLNWRYATKAFDPTQKLSDDQLFQLTESLRLSPSSFGLQPWKFIVVTNTAVREELVWHSWWQRQVADASHLIVLCAKDDTTEVDVQQYINTIATTTWAPLEALDWYKGMMNGALGSRTVDMRRTWAEKQVYIAQWFLLMAAAQLEIDACPMEWFDTQAYDKVLWLEGSGYHSVVLIPVGYRSSEDKYGQAPKVRYAAEQVIEYIK
jgi:nitroreductase